VKFLAQTISELNTKEGVLKLMMGALRPPPHTAQHGVVIVRTGKYQPEAKRQNIGGKQCMGALPRRPRGPWPLQNFGWGVHNAYELPQ